MNDKRLHQKQIVSKYIDIPTKILIKCKLSPNQISYIGLITSITASILLAIGILYKYMWFAWIIPSLILLSGIFDIFDGEVARRTNKVTKFGAFLDSNLDRISDLSFIIGFICSGMLNNIFGCILLFLILMISYIRTRAENEGVVMQGVGLMERGERLLSLTFILAIEIIIYHSSILIMGKPFVIYMSLITNIPVTPFFLIAIIVFTTLIIYTIIQRLKYTSNILKNNQEYL